MKYSFKLLFFIFLFAFLCQNSLASNAEKGGPSIELTESEMQWLSKHSEVVVGHYRDWAPYSFYDANGKPAGISVDYFNLVAKKAGFKVKVYHENDWDLIYAAGKNGKLDVTASMSNKDERKEWFIFPRIYMKLPLYIITRNNDSRIKEPADLSGKTISAVRGYWHGPDVLKKYPSAKIRYVDDDDTAFMEVSSGKSDATLAVVGVALNLISERGYYNLQLNSIYYKQKPGKGIAFGVHKGSPELASIIDKALSNISEEEKMTIMDKWLPLGQDHQQKKIKLAPKEKKWLKKSHAVRVYIIDFPPFLMVNSDQKPTGISIDYLNLVAKRTGVNFKYVISPQPFAKALDGLKQKLGPDLITTMIHTPEREKHIAFAKEYMRTSRVIFTAEGGPFIANMKDLFGKIVAVRRESIVHREIEKNYRDVKLMLFDTDAESIKAVSIGKADAYIGSMMVGSYLIIQNGLTNVKVAAPTKISDHIFSIGMRKDWPELSSIINKGIDSISPTERRNLRNKYFSIRYEYGIRPIDIVKWVAITASIFFVIIAIIVLWNRRLNKEIKNRLKAEKALQDSENRFRSLSDAAFEGIVFTEKGNILETNETFCKMFGYQPSELVQKVVTKLVSPEERENVKSKILSGYDKTYESCCLRKDGSAFLVEVQAKVFSYKGKQVRVTAIRDISEKKRSEEEIKRLKGILPLCSFCKKIRDDKGYWEKVDVYIHKYSEADISHGICPECMKKHYPKDFEEIKKDENVE